MHSAIRRLSCLVCLILAGALFAGAQVPRPTPKPQPKPSLLVTTDLDCNWTLDGISQGPLKALEVKNVRVSPGEHVVQATSSDGPDTFQTVVTAGQSGKAVQLLLKSVQQARLEKEQARQDNEKKEAAERKQEEASKQEEARKQEEEKRKAVSASALRGKWSWGIAKDEVVSKTPYIVVSLRAKSTWQMVGIREDQLELRPIVSESRVNVTHRREEQSTKLLSKEKDGYYSLTRRENKLEGIFHQPKGKPDIPVSAEVSQDNNEITMTGLQGVQTLWKREN
ncbi:MAG: hypothetical protein ABSD88_13800 [Candidatus Korobacteraceae bacterium]|jgi:hypothetical protein